MQVATRNYGLGSQWEETEEEYTHVLHRWTNQHGPGVERGGGGVGGGRERERERERGGGGRVMVSDRARANVA